MSTQELEQVIRQNITDIYKVIYTGKLTVQKIDPVGYMIKLGLGTPNMPHVICLQLEDKEVLKQLKQELKDLKLTSSSYFMANLRYPQLCNQPINQKCCDRR